MSTIAIVGAGPGLGQSIAKEFGARGFKVALIARNRAKLDAMVADLAGEGIRAVGYQADITVAAQLTAALDNANVELGPIDVLEYSPAPTPGDAGRLAPVDALELTIEAVLPQLEYYLAGGIAAIQTVLPGMIERGSGTILVTTGASSGPMIYPAFANIAAATAALRNWVLNLHAALEPAGVYAAHVALAAWIGKGGPKSEPAAIASAYWRLYEERTESELFYLDEAMLGGN